MASDDERPGHSRAGFTLPELLVALLVGSVSMAALGLLMLSSSTARSDLDVRLEAVQGMRVGIDSLVRDLRIAGACLDNTGTFTAIQGTNATGLDAKGAIADQDTITITYGRLHAVTLFCLDTNLVEPASNGDRTLFVADVDGFEQDMLILLRKPGGDFGEFRSIASTSSTLRTLTLREALEIPTTDRYPGCASASCTPSGIFAVHRRSYQVRSDLLTGHYLAVALDQTDDRPVFTPFARGFDRLDFRYRLADAGTTQVDLPADDAEWSQVNEVVVDARVRLQIPRKKVVGFYEFTSGVTAKPRNLIR